MKKIGIVGCGTIGTALGRAIINNFKNNIQLIGVYDVNQTQTAQFNAKLGIQVPVMSIKELVQNTDLIIECASQQAVFELLPLILTYERETIFLTTGGLFEYPNIFQIITDHPSLIHIPSGAIAGTDALSAVTHSKIDKIILTTKKGPEALKGAPYLEKKGIKLDSIREETIIFEGPVKDAVESFPANINVCATLALITKRPEIITVRIVAVPGLRRNTHRLYITGDFGTITCETQNEPSQDNPKTSFLAILSAISTLEKCL